jgi:hypothetical protein
MPVYDPKRSFPPTQGTFSLKRSSDVLPQSTWTKPGEKPIALTPQMRTELSRAIGEKNVRVLEANIGFTGKRQGEPPSVSPMFRYETAWKNAPRPVFKQATQVTANDAGATFLSNPCTVGHKFFWPNMTNENIDGHHRSHPMQLQVPGALQDIRAWLQVYGEPDPGKIPTGTMSTFTPSKKHVGKDISQTCGMSCKVDGYAWHKQYTSKMREYYGSRFEVGLKKEAEKQKVSQH